MMNDIKSKNFIWNTIGLTLNAFTSLAFLIIVKLINGSNIAGIFTYSFSVAMLFYIISNYYNRSYQVTNYNDSKNFNQYLSSRLLFSLISLIVCAIFLIINDFESIKNITIILLVGLRIIESISDCFFAYFQTENDLYKSGISYALKSILGVGFFIICDLLTNDIIISLIVTILVESSVLIFYDYFEYLKYKQKKIKLDYKTLKIIIYEAFPIFIFSFLSIYVGNLQKYVLTYYANNEIQMIFGILIMPATMVILIGTYLIMPFITKFKKYLKDNNKQDFKRLTLKICFSLIICGVICIIVAYFIGIPVLNLIYKIKLDEYLNMLLIIIVGSIFTTLCMVMSNILTVLEKNTIQLIPYTLLSVLGTLISLGLINKIGLNGACYSYLIVSFCLFVCFVIIYLISLKKWKMEE